ncbi:hypothetical protein CVT91_03145 [Candidatus Atribacteria bacterium HGW-Atribacteria-1]|nr:MAG: hypothetical protein CVT91_03145 [Candidatus Atribacteria bacterium HGW-Atribacteria-1]
MDKKWIKYLRNFNNKEALRFEEKANDESGLSGYLTAKGTKFPVIRGVPRFVMSEHYEDSKCGRRF